MSGVEFDMSEVRELAADLGRVSAEVARKIPPVVSKGALNIKNQLRADLAASTHFKGAALTVSYDLLDGGFEAEIGPSSEDGSPGNLANIAYFGGSNGGGGTVPDPSEAMKAEESKFLKALGDVVDGLI